MPPLLRSGRVRQSFLRTMRKHRLLERGERVLVAWSGGPDSTALLHLFLEIKKNWDLEIIPAHFNHALRPPARREEDFVRRAARALEIPLLVGTDDVAARAKSSGLSLEEAARFCRYEFLHRTADEAGATKIATGHTMNDQAETLLLRLLQGAGSRGLSGIHPAVEGRIIRPLLEVTSEDIRSYLGELGLPSVNDESNLDRRFLRNRIRLDLIPRLIKDFNPEAVRLLARTADILREEDACLETVTGRKAKGVVFRDRGKPVLRCNPLTRLPRGLARRVVRSYICGLKGDLRSVSYDDIEDVLNLEEQKQKHLGRDLILVRERGLIGPAGSVRGPVSFGYRWDGKKALEIGPAGTSFRSKILKPVRGRKLAFDDRRRAFLDAEKVRFPLEVRNRRPGDRYRPLGAPGSKKLKEIFRAKGIALRDREPLPVFLSRGQVIWVPGLPAAEEFKVAAGTRKILLIEKARA